MRDWHRWFPAGCFSLGCLLLLSVQRQARMPLRESLESLPREVSGFPGYDQIIDDEERKVAGMDDYILRFFMRNDSTPAYSVYVGYYEQQTQGRTIHSPRNCLPGGGWEVLSAGRRTLLVDGDSVTVNRYELAKEEVQALVYYWYQGRGRIESSEYRVKWDLLRDAALTGRTEEALVRIVVPLGDVTPENPDSLASEAARRFIPEVWKRLPAADD